MDIGFEQKVRERAYELWMASGMGDGMSLDHWCAAERDLHHSQPAPKEALAKATASKAPPAKLKAAPVKAPRAQATAKASGAKASGAKAGAKKPSLPAAAIN